MKAKPASSTSELKALRKQVNALQKELVKLQKAVIAASKPGRLRATQVVVDSLQVVDASGQLVAEIDKKGNLFCRTLNASTGKSTRGVFIDGVTLRSVSAGKIELLPDTGNRPAVEIDVLSKNGFITVRDLNTKQEAKLQGSGAALSLYDHQGLGTAILNGNELAGAKLTLAGRGAAAKASAELFISSVTKSGELSIRDAAGNVVGKLP